MNNHPLPFWIERNYWLADASWFMVWDAGPDLAQATWEWLFNLPLPMNGRELRKFEGLLASIWTEDALEAQRDYDARDSSSQ